MDADSVKAQVKELMNLQDGDRVDVAVAKGWYAIAVRTQYWFIKEQRYDMEKEGYVWQKSWIDTPNRHLVRPSSLWQVVEWHLESADAEKEWRGIHC